MVWRPFGRSGSGLDTFREVRKWSGDPPGGLEVVWRPSEWSGSGLETLREVWK